MVKVEDLGYKSSNLQEIPSKEQKKKNRVDVAISNLASTEPAQLLPPLPNDLFSGTKVES